MKICRTNTTVGCLLATLGAPALAEETAGAAVAKAPERGLVLGTIVVTGEANPLESLPASTTVIKGEEILDRSPLQSGVDVLRYVPGLQVSTLSQGAFRERMIMRGHASAGETIATFLDGVPLNESNGHGDGSIDLSTIIPEEIDRVEIIKGPFSARYGNFSQAGSINFITKNRVNETIARVSLGAWNSKRGAAAFGRAEDKLSQYYAVDFNHTDGFRENSETLRSNMAARWSYELSPQSTLRVGGRAYAARWDAPGYLNQAQWDAGEWEQSHTDLDAGEKERYDVNVNYNYKISDTDMIGVTAFRYDSDFIRWRDSGTGQTEENNRLSGTMVKLLYSKHGAYFSREDALLVGMDILKEDGYRRTWNNTVPWVRTDITSDGEYYQYTYSAYGQLEMKPTDPMNVVLGLRYDLFDVSLDQQRIVANAYTGAVDTFENDLSAFSPKAGVSYALSQAYTVFGNVGKAFYLPSSFDKFRNPQLEPVDLVSYEVGVRFQPTRSLHGSLAYFRMDSDGEVTRQGGPSGPLVNSGEVRRQGIDAEINLGLTENLYFIGTASVIDAKFQNYVTGGVDYSGNTVPEVPDYFYSAGLDYFHPRSGVGGRVNINGKGEVMLTADNAHRYGAYTYADAQVYYVDGPYTLDLKLGNLTDERYAEYAFYGNTPASRQYAPARPLNVTLSLKVEL